MGGGAPPSANEAVEIASSSTSVASIKRTIFFMGSILRGISLTIFFSREEIRSVRKNARWKTAARRSTDRLNRGLDVSSLWLEGDSALIPDSSVTLAGGKLRLTPALHRGLLRRPTDESGLTPTWNTGKSMLVAGFSQFNKTCFSTKTLLFCSGGGTRESGGSGATGFGSVRGPGTGLFVGGSRFVEAVACIGPAVGSSGQTGLVRHVAWGPHCWW